jgi:hypothetical protein
MWYDIIDSKGKRSGLTGDALRVYRQRVRSFKDNVIRDVIGLCRDASRQDATIYPWQGQLNSKDDERHLFVTGSRSIGWLIKACEIVTARALSSGVAIRAIAITADFAGIPAYRYDGEPGVEGEAFWEHLSIIKESLKNEERSRNWNVAGRAPSNSILWVCGELVNNLALEGQIALSKTADTVVASEIDDLRIETRALGGVASC